MSGSTKESVEIVRRVRRCEIRITRLCMHLGINPKDACSRVALKGTELQIDDLSVSQGEILKAVRGLPLGTQYTITHQGREIGRLSI